MIIIEYEINNFSEIREGIVDISNRITSHDFSGDLQSKHDDFD